MQEHHPIIHTSTKQNIRAILVWLLCMCGLAFQKLPAQQHTVMTETEAKHKKTLRDYNPIEVLPRFNQSRWCPWISNDPGTLFNNSDQRFVQSIVIYGNPQLQYSYVSGTDALGQRFSGEEFELRRFKLGVRIHFFQFFTASLSSDMRDDSGANDSEYNSFDYALRTSDIIFDAQDAFHWESYQQFQFRLGFFRVPSNASRAQSSNAMRAVERSSLANYSGPDDSVGILLSSQKGDWSMDLGFFSSKDINNGKRRKASDEQGTFWLAHLGHEFGERKNLDTVRGDLRILINNDEEAGETFEQAWVVSLSTTMRKERWRLSADLIVGDNGSDDNPLREGVYWGATILPSLWILEDRLEATFRYQFAQADNLQGFRISAHSIRRIADSANANILGGYGDQHHSAYIGLNYYFCGDHTKAMVGMQWDDLRSGNLQVFEGLTTWMALRLYF